jgi:PAS domain S-box-containing protein
MKSLTRNLSLSNREEEILLLASRGLTDRQISGELGIRAGTINTHWSRIRLKLGAATRSEAVSILLKEKADVTQQVLEAEKQNLIDEIAQRKEVESELRDSRKLLQTVLNNAPVILWSTDETGAFLTIEGKVPALLGVKPTANLKQRAAILSEVIEQDAVQEALTGQEVVRLAEREGVWLETRISPMRTAKGVVAGLIGVSTDVTSRKVAEQALLEGQELLRGIMAMSPTITHVDDLVRMRQIYTSPSVEAILGYTPQAIRAMGHDLAGTIIHPDDRERFEAHLVKLKYLKDGEVGESIHRLRHSTGEWRWFLERTTVFKRGDDGKVECVLTVAQDIHEIKVAEELALQGADS